MLFLIDNFYKYLVVFILAYFLYEYKDINIRCSVFALSI